MMASELVPGWSYWIGLMFLGACFLISLGVVTWLYARMFARMDGLLKEAQRAALAASEKPSASSYAHLAKSAEAAQVPGTASRQVPPRMSS